MKFVKLVVIMSALCGGAQSSEIFTDKDLQRNRSRYPDRINSVSVEKKIVTLDGHELKITVLKKDKSEYFYFVMHDEEDDAFDAMVWAVDVFGGVGVALENGENRKHVDLGDVNTQFARENNPEFNDYFSGFVNSSEITIALHNNWDHPDGSFHLNAPIFTAPSPCDAGGDEDNVIVMSRNSGTQNTPKKCNDSMVKNATNRGLNVAWALYLNRIGEPYRCTSRCNFQKFSTGYLGTRYFNLESQHDIGFEIQAKQLCAILDPSNVEDRCQEFMQ